MEVSESHLRLMDVIDQNPQLKEILVSEAPLETKRKNVRNLLSEMLIATFDDDPAIPPLEWILTRNAINMFRTIVSKRSERLAGFSLLRYLDDLLHRDGSDEGGEPSAGFLEELSHLIRGIVGKTGIYSGEPPEFLVLEGGAAARLRSEDLSEMAKVAAAFKERYPCGLDDDVIRERSVNKRNIIAYFGASDLEWEDWRWHTQNIIRDADTLAKLVRLTEEEYRAVKMARENRIPFGITPYYLSLMDVSSSRKRDYAVRAQVIPPPHYVREMIASKAERGTSMDFMIERDTSPIEGITRRYPNIVILKPVMTCPQICVYCQRNWEIEDVYSKDAVLSDEKLARAMEWIEKTPEINEVLVTGGDPLLLGDERIGRLLERLAGIDHVERIRIGTRTPVTLPQRITDALVKGINRFHLPGKREVIVITHFEHLYEITPQAMAAVQKFRRYGMAVYNQLVYTFYNSKKFETAALRHKLRLIGVTPYYTFNTKGKGETDEYRVPIARLLQEQHEEARLLPGTVRTDEIVFNVPRLGKNYLKASQHHDVIAILPDGRRVYEFHPWEKKLSLMNTYVYTDTAIYDYLKRLEAGGEALEEYKTIWYYS